MYKPMSRMGVVLRCIRNPRLAYSRLETEFLSPDPVYLEQSRWIHGTLPRVPLTKALPQALDVNINILRPFDRTWGTSATVDELACLLAIARVLQPKKILEIGTFDGNTTLNLAAGTDADVLTLDLPPAQEKDAHIPNLTDRQQLGRQFRGHPAASRIRQVYGDSTQLDWNVLGPPFDLIFIDGAHHYQFVASDTRNARACLSARGAILWHDYGIFADVSRVVDETARSAEDLKVYAIEGTRLAVAFRKQ